MPAWPSLARLKLFNHFRFRNKRLATNYTFTKIHPEHHYSRPLLFSFIIVEPRVLRNINTGYSYFIVSKSFKKPTFYVYSISFQLKGIANHLHDLLRFSEFSRHHFYSNPHPSFFNSRILFKQ